jgi:hypothetical protein
MFKIGCDPELAKNMIRLIEPGPGPPTPYVYAQSGVKYVTGGEPRSWPVRTDHHAAKIKL